MRWPSGSCQHARAPQDGSVVQGRGADAGNRRGRPPSDRSWPVTSRGEQGHGRSEPAKDSFATAALGRRRRDRGHWARWRRGGPGAAVERTRSGSGGRPKPTSRPGGTSTPRPRWRGSATPPRATTCSGPRWRRRWAAPTRRSPSSPGSRTATRRPPRRGCWPVRSSCGGTASAGRKRRYWPRSQLDPTLVPAHRQLIYIDGMLLRRRELNEHFQALARLAPMTFDDVFSLVPDPQHRLGAARARPRT